MPIPFTCPQCAKALSIPSKKIGHSVTCPACGGAFLANANAVVKNASVVRPPPPPHAPVAAQAIAPIGASSSGVAPVSTVPEIRPETFVAWFKRLRMIHKVAIGGTATIFLCLSLCCGLGALMDVSGTGSPTEHPLKGKAKKIERYKGQTETGLTRRQLFADLGEPDEILRNGNMQNVCMYVWRLPKDENIVIGAVEAIDGSDNLLIIGVSYDRPKYIIDRMFKALGTAVR